MLNKINKEKRQKFFVMYLIMFSSLPDPSRSPCTMTTQYYAPPLSLTMNKKERKEEGRDGGTEGERSGGRNRGRNGVEGGRDRGRKKEGKRKEEGYHHASF